jgi:hypothetical protein
MHNCLWEKISLGEFNASVDAIQIERLTAAEQLKVIS